MENELENNNVVNPNIEKNKKTLIISFIIRNAIYFVYFLMAIFIAFVPLSGLPFSIVAGSDIEPGVVKFDGSKTEGIITLISNFKNYDAIIDNFKAAATSENGYSSIATTISIVKYIDLIFAILMIVSLVLCVVYFVLQGLKFLNMDKLLEGEYRGITQKKSGDKTAILMIFAIIFTMLVLVFSVYVSTASISLLSYFENTTISAEKMAKINEVYMSASSNASGSGDTASKANAAIGALFKIFFIAANPILYVCLALFVVGIGVSIYWHVFVSKIKKEADAN